MALHYIPALTTKAAEMRAYDELSAETKKLLLPLFTLQRKGTAPSIRASLDGVATATRGSPFIVDFSTARAEEKTPAQVELERKDRAAKREREGEPPAKPRTERQKAQDAKPQINARLYNQELSKLTGPTGHLEWLRMTTGIDGAIPVLRWEDEASLTFQLGFCSKEANQIALRVSIYDQNRLSMLLASLSSTTIEPDTIVILDAGHFRGNRSDVETKVAPIIRSLLRIKCDLVVLAGSFPKSVVDHVSPLSIEERKLFATISAEFPHVNYGDYAAIQPASDRPGGGGFYPHIEVAHATDWHFERSGELSDETEYVKLAKKLMATKDIWNRATPCWGIEMIKRAAAGTLDDGRGHLLTHPAPWISVRSNQHMTVQARAKAPKP